MEVKYFIQDVKTGEYYWRYQIHEGFNANISEATSFETYENAEKELMQEYLIDLDITSGRFLEIVKYYDFT